MKHLLTAPPTDSTARIERLAQSALRGAACAALVMPIPLAARAEQAVEPRLHVDVGYETVELRLVAPAPSTAGPAQSLVQNMRDPDAFFQFPAAAACHIENADAVASGASGAVVGTYSYCCDGVSAGITRLDAMTFSGFESLGVGAVAAYVSTGERTLNKRLTANDNRIRF